MNPSTSPSLVFLVLLGACAGNAPPSAPAPAASAPAPSVAPPASGAPPAAVVAPPEPTIAPAAPTVAPASVPSVIVSLAPGATDAPAPPPAPSVEEPAVPALSTDQKAFVTGQLLGTEVVFITVTDATATCASAAALAKNPAAKGARMAELRVLWKTGYYDFSNRMAQGKLGTYQGTFWLKEDATQGGIQIRAAPMQQGGTGRIHVKASRPGSAQALDAELEVTVCAALDFTKKGTK